jgi:hypothetical protein
MMASATVRAHAHGAGSLSETAPETGSALSWRGWRLAVTVGVWLAVARRNVLAVTAERQLVVAGRWAKTLYDDGFIPLSHNDIQALKTCLMSSQVLRVHCAPTVYIGGRRSSHAASYRSGASHGFTASTPVSTKSSTLRVASPALQLRQIAAICASAILIGRPARSREATISA